MAKDDGSQSGEGRKDDDFSDGRCEVGDDDEDTMWWRFMFCVLCGCVGVDSDSYGRTAAG